MAEKQRITGRPLSPQSGPRQAAQVSVQKAFCSKSDSLRFAIDNQAKSVARKARPVTAVDRGSD